MNLSLKWTLYDCPQMVWDFAICVAPKYNLNQAFQL